MPLRIGIDYRMLSAGRPAIQRGIGRFTQQQLREVLRLDRESEFVLVCRPDHDAAEVLPEIAAAANVSRVLLPEELCRGGWEGGPDAAPEDRLRAAAELQAFLEGLGLDLFHLTAPFVLHEPLPAHFDHCALVATHYDLIPLVFPRHYFGGLEQKRLYERYRAVLPTLLRADRLLAISDYVRVEAEAYLGIPRDRIDVAHPVADPCFRVLPAEDVARKLGLLRRRTGVWGEFLLCVSHLHHSKNLDTLLRGYSLLPEGLRERLQLVVVCEIDEPGRLGILARGRELGLAEGQLVVPGYVPDGELTALYNAAFAYVHPSRYEGFGLPVLEAMGCGAAVVASAATSLLEVVGDAGLLADPEDPASFCRCIQRLAGEPGLRGELRERALERAALFLPERLGEATLRCYQRAAWPSRRGGRRRARIALWSPVPPQPSGVADYAAELAGPLSEWAELELFVDDGVLPSCDVLARWPVFHHSAFARRNSHRPFDAVIYQMGASTFHLYAARALARWPGVVVLHDLTWSFVLYAQAAGTGSVARFRAELAAMEGSEAAAGFDRLGGEGGETLEAFLTRHLMLGRLVEGSRALIVHLSHAQRELAARYPGTRVLTVPMGVSDPRASLDRGDGAPGGSAADRAVLRRHLGLPPSAFLIGAFGIADPVKRLETAVRALADLVREVPEALLVIVGEFYDAAYRRRIEELAARLGVAERVRLTGRVPAGDLDRLLLACEVVVNLRHPSRKQMSATLLRAVAAGQPVAVSDLPEWCELPETFCFRVAAGGEGEGGAGEAAAALEAGQLAGFLGCLARQPERREEMSRAAREYYLRHATVQRMAERYREVLAQVMDPALEEAAQPAEEVPAQGEAGQGRRLPFGKVCELEDFGDAGLAARLDELFPGEPHGGITAGRPARRRWQAAMSARALLDLGALGPASVLLGVAEGDSPLLFYLTRHAARVYAADRYWTGEGAPPGREHETPSAAGSGAPAAPGWAASPAMLAAPELLAPFPFERDRLVVQHMDPRWLNHPDASFDAVFAGAALARLPGPRDIAAAAFEMGRVLRPGGLLVLAADYLILGPPGANGWAGHVLLSWEALLRFVVEASGCDLVAELDCSPSSPSLPSPPSRLTLTSGRRLPRVPPPLGDTAEPPAWARGSDLVQQWEGQVFGAALLVLRKGPRYPARDNSWAQPSRPDDPGSGAAGGAASATSARAAAPGAPCLAGCAAPPHESGAGTAIQAAIQTGAAPPAASEPDHRAAVERAYGLWDGVRARSGLDVAASGAWPARALGFFRRTLARLRDLGIRWDRERDLLRGVLDEQHRLASQAAALAGEVARLRGDFEAATAGPPGAPVLRERLNTFAYRQQVERGRIEGLAATVAGLSARVRESSSHLQVLHERLEELEASSGVARPPAVPSGKELAPAAVMSLLAHLERALPELAACAAVEVSFSDVRSEMLLFAAHRHYGVRLSAMRDPYRSPNDAWLHFDSSEQRTRASLLESAAARLAPGGRFLLITHGPVEGLASHPALDPAGTLALELSGEAMMQALIWIRR